MGMSTHVIGFIAPDNDIYIKHAKVLEACADARISELPRETADYFGSKYPDLSLLEDKLTVKIPVHKYIDIGASGFEVVISEIPAGVEKIRFFNSY